MTENEDNLDLVVQLEPIDLKITKEVNNLKEFRVFKRKGYNDLYISGIAEIVTDTTDAYYYHLIDCIVNEQNGDISDVYSMIKVSDLSLEEKEYIDMLIENSGEALFISITNDTFSKVIYKLTQAAENIKLSKKYLNTAINSIREEQELFS